MPRPEMVEAANVLIQHIRSRVPYDEGDQEWHDLAQLHSTVQRAQEFTR